jgi:ribosomal protein S18 acetylase RimI-like enzyme
MTHRPDELQSRLIELVRSSSMLMRAMHAARVIDPPDWLIGAGAIRDLVWDHLHGFDGTRGPKDVDLVFFDPGSLGSDREQSILEALQALEPDIPWDVTNQAAVHCWYPEVFGIEVQPLTSSTDGVDTWPETAASIAIRLQPDDSIQVIAPCGLEDVFGLICRRNLRRVTEQEYRRRIRDKRVAERWPHVRVIRSAGEEDIASVLDLWTMAGNLPSVSDSPDGLAGLLAADSQALLVAELGGVLVGSLIAAWDGWRGSFYRLAVLPEHRRRGLAAMLLGEGERRLRERGAVRLTAIVADDDAGAMGFWRASGYVRQGHRVRFVRQPDA